MQGIVLPSGPLMPGQLVGKLSGLTGIIKSIQKVTKTGSTDTSFSEQTQTVTIPSVKLANSFVIPWLRSNNGASLNAWTPVLTAADKVSFYSQSNASMAGLTMSALVVEFFDGIIKSKQNITKAVATNAGTGSTTSTVMATKTAKTLGLLQTQHYWASVVDSMDIVLTNETTLTWSYIMGSAFGTINWRALLVEFN